MTKARDIASAAPAPAGVTSTELGYVDGVTSAIQTQLNTKQAVVSGVDDTEIGYLNGVTSAIQTQLNSKQAVVSGVSDTEISYLDGVTSAIQTQLDAKAVYPSQTGNSGRYLTTNGTSASWGTVASAPDFIAGKNRIINGDFNIWQRGTSFTPASSTDGYDADRMISFWLGTGTTTISRQTFTPGTAPVAGYESQYFKRIALSSGATYFSTQQRVEDVRTFAGQTVTFSFWAKATSSVGFSIFFRQSTGAGDFDTTTPTVTVASNTWTRYSVTATLPSLTGRTLGATNSLHVILVQNSGTVASNTFDTWGWQLEAGSVATPFTTATGTLQGELAACSRYFQRYGTGAASFYVFGGLTRFTDGAYFGSTAAHQNFVFPVPMRTTPSMSTTGTWKGFGNSNHDAVGSLSIQFGNNQSIFIRFEKSSGSFNSDTGYVQSNDGGYVNLSAEL